MLNFLIHSAPHIILLLPKDKFVSNKFTWLYDIANEHANPIGIF